MSAAVRYPEPERERALPRVEIFPPELRKLLLRKCKEAEEADRAKRATLAGATGGTVTRWSTQRLHHVESERESRVDADAAEARARHHLDLGGRCAREAQVHAAMHETWRNRAQRHHARADQWASVALRRLCEAASKLPDGSGASR